MVMSNFEVTGIYNAIDLEALKMVAFFSPAFRCCHLLRGRVAARQIGVLGDRVRVVTVLLYPTLSTRAPARTSGLLRSM